MSGREFEFDPKLLGIPRVEDGDDFIIKEILPKDPHIFRPIEDLASIGENFTEVPLGGLVDDEGPEKPKVIIVRGRAYVYTETEAGVYEYKPFGVLAEPTSPDYGSCVDGRLPKKEDKAAAYASQVREILHGIKSYDAVPVGLTEQDLANKKLSHDLNFIDESDRLFRYTEQSHDVDGIDRSFRINKRFLPKEGHPWNIPNDRHLVHHVGTGSGMVSFLYEPPVDKKQEMRERRLIAVANGTALTVEVPLLNEEADQPPLTLEDVKQATEILGASDTAKPWYLRRPGDLFTVTATGRLASRATIHPLHGDPEQHPHFRTLEIGEKLGTLRNYDNRSDLDNPFANPDEDGNIRLMFEREFGDTTQAETVIDILAYLATRPTQ